MGPVDLEELGETSPAERCHPAARAAGSRRLLRTNPALPPSTVRLAEWVTAEAERVATLYRLDKPDAGTGIATAGSEAGASVRVVSAQGAVSTAGGTLIRVGERPMETFPELKPYPASF